MKNIFLKIVFSILAFFLLRSSVFAENNPLNKGEKEASHDDHEEKDHADHGDEEGEEGSSVVGPGKGITEKGKMGFKFSPEAEKTFNNTTSSASGNSIAIPRDALVRFKDGKYIYRVRDGWISKVPVKVIESRGNVLVVQGDGLNSGDRIIVSRVGFVRIAEIFSEGGASHGHSH